MTGIDWKLMKARMNMRRRREEHMRAILLRAVVCAALIGVAVMCAGFYGGPQRLVEVTYTVQEGDTLWGISEEYLQKNTGGRRCILEFIEGIKELNPELVKNKGQVYPGQMLRINYWVAE